MFHAHIVRAQWSANQFIAIQVGIGRHSGHFVARNIFPVKTQRDDGDLSGCKSNHGAVGEAEKSASSESVVGEIKIASTARTSLPWALHAATCI
jgi:hypothetical protein